MVASPLGRLSFQRETGIKYSDWHGRFWARWNDAVREAGYSPNEMKTAYDETVLLDKYILLARELSRVPVKGEMLLKTREDPSFPSHTAYEKRYGSKTALVARVAEYCRSRVGHEDVAQWCSTYLSQNAEASDEAEPDQDEIGFVYLMKSGRFFKIGRSNAAGRREYELAIQLPEKLKTLHTIKRFAAKHKNGEWFDLDSNDVRAFSRRRFM
jgi:hypothetical protein